MAAALAFWVFMCWVEGVLSIIPWDCSDMEVLRSEPEFMREVLVGIFVGFWRFGLLGWMVLCVNVGVGKGLL